MWMVVLGVIAVLCFVDWLASPHTSIHSSQKKSPSTLDRKLSAMSKDKSLSLQSINETIFENSSQQSRPAKERSPVLVDFSMVEFNKIHEKRMEKALRALDDDADVKAAFYKIREDRALRKSASVVRENASKLQSPKFSKEKDHRNVNHSRGSCDVVSSTVRASSCSDGSKAGSSTEKHKFEARSQGSPAARVSTTRIGKIMGITAKPMLFDELYRLGYIVKEQGKWMLTDLGASVDGGNGSYNITDDGERFIVWPENLSNAMVGLKMKVLSSFDFRLFHMTHLDNVRGILSDGLLSHNLVPAYKDISNLSVNARRIRADPIHGRQLHDYVPLYFNPRNAMLYEKQRQLGDGLVLVEVSRDVCLSDYTIFSERNAASARCRFTSYVDALGEFEWKRIQAPTWKIDGVTNLDLKQIMMSECLVHNDIGIQNILKLHVRNNAAKNSVAESLKGALRLDIDVSPGLFF